MSLDCFKRTSQVVAYLGKKNFNIYYLIKIPLKIISTLLLTSTKLEQYFDRNGCEHFRDILKWAMDTPQIRI
jgi:hypothetical protein